MAVREAGRAGSGVAFAPRGGANGLPGAALRPEDEDPEDEDPAGSRIDGLSYFERLRGAEPAPEALDFADARSAGRAEPAPGPVSEPGGGSFVVQVMSVRGSAAAEDVKADLEAKGYPVVIEPMRRSPGALHRVRVGPYADRAEAELVSHRLQTEEQFRPWVTQP